jgi:Zn-dependent protease
VTPTIRIGKLFGIEIGLNWSLVFVFVLVAWTLGASVLPAEEPRQASWAYWVAGVVGSFAFYGCLLAHELSHAVVARRNGVKVAGITLWLFGGVSQLQGEPRSARAEALITAVGPLTSLAVAAVSLGLAFGTAAVNAPPLVSDLLVWLALLNLALALFNMVPAFPLDGGRLLSSIFWWRTGSRRQGVHLAVRVGRVFALLMIAGGAVELFFGSVVNGVWIAFIGWFLLTAGGAEEAATTTRSLIRSLPVSAAMTSPVVTVPDWVTIEQFVTSLVHQYRFGTYPLHNPAGELTGVARLPDLLVAARTGSGQKRLRDVARPIDQVPRAAPGEDLERVLERLGPGLQQRVLVFDGERLVGILSPSDVMRLVAARRAEADQRPGSGDGPGAPAGPAAGAGISG